LLCATKALDLYEFDDDGQVSAFRYFRMRKRPSQPTRDTANRSGQPGYLHLNPHDRMRTTMRFFLLAAFVCMPTLLAMPSLAQTPQEALPADARAALERIPEAWVERALAADWEGIAELYHEDAVLMPIDAPAAEGRAGIRETFAHMLGRAGGVDLDHLSVEVLEVEGAGELVYVGAAYRLGGTMTVDGTETPFEQEGSYVNILRRDEAGTWRIYRQIINRDHPLPGPGA